MSIHFHCDHCVHLLSIGTHKAGSTIHCPVCLGIVTVPLPVATLAPDDPATWWRQDDPVQATPMVIASPPAPIEAEWWLTSPEPISAPSPVAVLPTTMPRIVVTDPAPIVEADWLPEPSMPKVNRIPRLTAVATGVGVSLLGVVIVILAIPPEDTKPDDGLAREFADLLAGRKRVVPREESKTPRNPSTPFKSLAAPVKDPALPHPPAKAKQPEEKQSSKILMKRRVERGETDLLEQLRHTPELMLDRTVARAESAAAVQAAMIAAAAKKKDSDPTLALLDRRDDLAGLPFRRGDASRLTASTSDKLEGGSQALRDMLSSGPIRRAFNRNAGGPGAMDAGTLSRLLMCDKDRFSKWLRPEAIPALMQLLMGENETIREILVDQLSRIEGKEASKALAQRALFDLHPRLRELAIVALGKRPAREYRPILLAGFEHPWPVIADHAAEALVALKMKDAVPALLTFLDKPDPLAPYQKLGSRARHVKEMVRINHQMNCLMCHPVSLNTNDRLRGLVSPTNQAIATRRAYDGQPRGTFIRADTTYLEPDFSTALGKWPTHQRFDFIVRERLANDRDVKASVLRKATGPTEQQRAAFFALRELTGKDPGPTIENWKKLFPGKLLDLGTQRVLGTLSK